MEEFETRSQKNKKKRKKRRGLRIFATILLVFFLGIGIYLANLYRNINNASNEAYESVEGVESMRESHVTLGKQEPISVLLLGVDTGDLGREEQGRSDSIMVATINPRTQKTVLLSIPRDTYTEIVGHGTTDKINHAYAFGGTAMAINSVQNLLNIPIDYHVTVNMAGIKEIVDAVGGIYVVSPLTFNMDGYQFNEGESTYLNGDAALAFARMRYEDPNGDTGRQERQRIIIEGVLSEITNPAILGNYQTLLGSLSSNVQTSFQMGDFIALTTKSYLNATRDITSEQLGGSGGLGSDGIYYNFVSDEELYRVQSLLRSELELD